MLGSHFDLAKEIAQIAAKRKTTEPLHDEAPELTTKAYADFDKKVRDFVEMIAPSGSQPIYNPFADRD